MQLATNTTCSFCQSQKPSCIVTGGRVAICTDCLSDALRCSLSQRTSKSAAARYEAAAQQLAKARDELLFANDKIKQLERENETLRGSGVDDTT